jgi:hypothetical protein
VNVLAGREIIFEIKASGGYAQVCAIDCATGLEVFVTTPVNAARSDQHSLALRKLAKVLADEGIISSSVTPQEKGDTPTGMPPSSKRGFLA